MKSIEDMLRTIGYHVHDSARETGRGQLSPAVLAALARVPRERFVPASARHLAYADGPLPIGHGQTISQPFIVALMTELIEPASDHRVLDVGSGSGYQAAVLAGIVAEVYGIEIVPQLAAEAESTLHSLGCDNVRLRIGDGRQGWPEAAPFDGIVVAAASADIPVELRRQLRVGGRMILPVTLESGWQELQLVTRHDEQHYETRGVLGVRFVPLVHARGD